MKRLEVSKTTMSKKNIFHEEKEMPDIMMESYLNQMKNNENFIDLYHVSVNLSD